LCSAHVSEERRRELGLAVRSVRELGGQALLLTLTEQHTRHHSLARTLGGLLEAWRYMQTRPGFRALLASYGVLGYVRALEVTWGHYAGWHPHLHLVLFVSSPLSGVQLIALEDGIANFWMAALVRLDLSCSRRHGINLVMAGDGVDAYVSKFGSDWGVEHEVTKSHLKHSRVSGHYTPFDLARASLDASPVFAGSAAPLFREYAAHFKGKKQLQWSKNLGELLCLDAFRDDSGVANSIPPSYQFLYSLSSADWSAIRELGREADVIVFAASCGDDLASLIALVASIVAQWADRGGAVV
jgi:hypothetical protein